MRAMLTEKNGDELVVALTMTRRELAQAKEDPQLLVEAISGACRGLAEISEPEESSCPAEEEPVSAGRDFTYRDVRLDDLGGDREESIERIVRLLIDKNEIPVNMAEIEKEAEFNFKAVMQKMRYDVMFGRAPEAEADVDPDKLLAEIREELIFEEKENFIFRKVIETEGIEVSPEELLAEAEAMARRQDTTLKMVKSFFGEDLMDLAEDVKKRKAKDFLYALAQKE